jgi:Flp pilus assembly protein TadG
MVRRRAVRWRRDRGGASAVDFALVAPVFLTLLTLTMEVGWQLAIGAGLDHATRIAARWAATGQAAPAGATRAQEVARIIRERSGMPINATQLTVTEQAYASLAAMTTSGASTAGLGSANSLVNYRVEYLADALTPVGRGLVPAGMMRHSFTVVVRNEPYVTSP